MLICVDLDGTLLDTVPANAASYRAALEELGFTVTDEYYAERCNGGHYTRFLPPLMGGAPSTADVERVHDRKKALYSDFLDAVRPNTALMEILKTMRAAGHDLACVTTGSKQNATEVLEHFGVREWFGLIVTGEDVEKQKPDPEGYCRAMEHFRVTPADTMIFGCSGWSNFKNCDAGGNLVRTQNMQPAARLPGGYGIRPYGVGVDARIDPESARRGKVDGRTMFAPTKTAPEGSCLSGLLYL